MMPTCIITVYMYVYSVSMQAQTVLMHIPCQNIVRENLVGGSNYRLDLSANRVMAVLPVLLFFLQWKLQKFSSENFGF